MIVRHSIWNSIRRATSFFGFCRNRAFQVAYQPDKIYVQGNDRRAAQGDQANALFTGSDADLRALVPDQDHRAIKRLIRPMLGFKVFRCARIILDGIETMHMIKEGQQDCPESEVASAASQLYSLAF